MSVRPTLLALALAVAGCASVQPHTLQSPAAGGAAWRELESEHFVLRTDYPEWAARETLQGLERSARALIALALPAGAPVPTDRIEVIAFEHFEDYQALLDNEHVAGDFRVDGGGVRPRVLISGQGNFLDLFDRLHHVMQHELTHWVWHQGIHNAPVWLDEGVARYWESLRLEDGQAIIGGLPALHLLADWLPAREVLTADRTAFYGEDALRHYSTAWGVVYLLYTKHADAFAKYVAALAAGARSDAAWRGAFGNFGAREIDAEMHELYSMDRPWAHVVPLVVPARDPKAIRAMAPADVHLMWAELRPSDDDSKHLDAIAADLATAERLAPDSPVVQARLGALEMRRQQPAAAAARLDRALVAHPNDEELLRVRAESMLAEQVGRPKQSRDFGAVADLTQRLVRDDASAPSLRLAAVVVGLFGDKRRALALAERATARAPDCSSCFEVLSESREAVGDLPGAIAAGETAMRLLPDGVNDTRLGRWVESLKKKLP